MTKLKKRILTAGFSVVALGSVVALADLSRHPHLLAADRSVEHATLELEQAASPHGFGGHRERAIQLLRDARREIIESAEYADHH